MKTNIRILVLILLGYVLFYTSCIDTTSQDPSGDARDKFVGEWNLLENPALKSLKSQSYVLTIEKDEGNSSQVFLRNFGNSGSLDIYAVGIVTSGQIVVSSQNMSNNWIVEGSGKMTNVVNTAMSWDYSITAGGDKVNYKATGAKQ